MLLIDWPRCRLPLIRDKQEKGIHSMERIMNIDEQEDRIIITTTGVHMVRRIG